MKSPKLIEIYNLNPSTIVLLITIWIVQRFREINLIKFSTAVLYLIDLKIYIHLCKTYKCVKGYVHCHKKIVVLGEIDLIHHRNQFTLFNVKKNKLKCILIFENVPKNIYIYSLLVYSGWLKKNVFTLLIQYLFICLQFMYGSSLESCWLYICTPTSPSTIIIYQLSFARK